MSLCSRKYLSTFRSFLLLQRQQLHGKARKIPKWTFEAPHLWSQHYPNAAGKQQSPVELVTPGLVRYDQSLTRARFLFNYKPQDFTALKNTGMSWQLSANDRATSSLVTSLRPQEEFRVTQMHAHWGCDAHDGSEHKMGGHGAAMEIHIVHFNAKYDVFRQAMNFPDGLLVIGIFCHEGAHNEALEPLCQAMPNILYKGQETMLDAFDLQRVLPGNKSEFFVYDGSLTTPPCNECVIWLVFKEGISISQAQLDKCRSLHHSASVDSASRMVRNVRPLQPLNARPILCSFPLPTETR